MTTLSDRVSKQTAARLLGLDTYVGRKCSSDGTRIRRTETGGCVECERYHRAIQSGRIDGTDNRTAAQKAGAPAPTVKCGWNDEAGWTEEMRQAHAEAIKRGQARRRKTRLNEGVSV